MPRTTKALKHSYPLDFDLVVARKLLNDVRDVTTLSERMRIISGYFLGCPYIMNPLIGSTTTPEAFTVSLEGFDCVTYIETVLALASANSVDQFVEFMRQIRYKDDQIDWRKRNHYMTGWIKSNARRGFVKNVTRGRDAISKSRTLGTLEGLPPKSVTFKCFPKRIYSRIKTLIEDGDLIFFASTRQRLDVFHTGLLFRDGDQIVLRHASHSQNGVVEQPLTEFLKRNRMAGLILVRPVKESSANRTNPR